METIAVAHGFPVGIGGRGVPGDPGWNDNGSYRHGRGCRLSVCNGRGGFARAIFGKGEHTSHEGHHASAVGKLPIHCIVSCEYEERAMQVESCVVSNVLKREL